MSLNDEDNWSPPIWMRPASISPFKGAAPLKGTCVMDAPVCSWNHTPNTWMYEPGPVEP
ncbi:hypothetical protein D3C77_786780 [compost metagenome]